MKTRRRIIALISAALLIGLTTNYLSQHTGTSPVEESWISPPTVGYPDRTGRDQLQPKEAAPLPISFTGTSRVELRTATILLEVEDLSKTTGEVFNVAERLGGYVTSSSSRGDRYASVTIRVPKDEFFNAIRILESLGTLKDKIAKSDDVTEEYIDLKARRSTLQIQEERLRGFLPSAKTVEELLKVERELERVRSEIERLTGRINYLENRAELSTIQVNLTKTEGAAVVPIDWVEPFRTGLTFLYSVVRGLVILGLTSLPLALLATPAYYVYKHRRMKSQVSHS